MTNRLANNSWYRRLDAAIRAQGGMFNAHLHLDRAGTLDEVYMESVGHRILEKSYVSLHAKHGLITNLHQGRAYQRDDFHRRVNAFVDEMIDVNTVRADTLVDVTADGVGLAALQWMEEIKRQRAGQIDLRIAAYSPLGFEDSEPQRWDLLVEGARRADFLAALPEADDIAEYPTHIGFYEHCRRFLVLAKQINKPLHVHTDQRNEPSENGTEQLVAAVREFGAPVSETGEPMVWAVHLISPSTYQEARFDALVKGMLECNIGVITCPSAALGMRQYRPILTPTYNSIPRVLEMLAAGVHVRVGSDNVADICSPSTTADLVDEIFVLSAALRFYQPEILARLAVGAKLDEAQRHFIAEHLAKNDEEISHRT
jgi:cytosine/adenosine deaminase-related metal-dependent hydrolase